MHFIAFLSLNKFLSVIQEFFSGKYFQVEIIFYFLLKKKLEILKYGSNISNMLDKLLCARQFSNMPDLWILAYKYATWPF